MIIRKSKYLFPLIIIIVSILTFIMLFILFKDKTSSTYIPIIPSPITPSPITPSPITSSFGINLDNLSLKTDPSSSTFPANWPLTKTPITSLRTYFISLQSLKWLRYLTLNNTDVFIGMQSIEQINQLIGELKTWSPAQLNHILAYSVANELPPTEANVNLMIDTAAQLKTALSLVKGAMKPVTACLQFIPGWISGGKFTTQAIKLFKALDPIICFNIYGLFFSSQTSGNVIPSLLNKALSWSESDGSIVFDNFKSIKSAMNDAGLSDYKFWVTEVGWGSAPFGKINDQWANMKNAKQFYTNFLKIQKQDASPDRIFWFCMRDDPNGVNNESFGLYTGQTPNLISKFN